MPNPLLARRLPFSEEHYPSGPPAMSLSTPRVPESVGDGSIVLPVRPFSGYTARQWGIPFAPTMTYHYTRLFPKTGLATAAKL